MSDDEDEDTHFCLRCNATITGLAAYVAHRKSKCNQTQRTDCYGPGPSGLQAQPRLADSPEPSRNPEENLLLHAGLTHSTLAPSTSDEAEPKVDFFSSLCLQSSSKTGESSSTLKPHGVLTRSKILEKSLPRDSKTVVVLSKEVDGQEETESEESDDERHPPPTSGGKWLPGFRPTHRASSTSVLWKSATTPEPELKAVETEAVARRSHAPSPNYTPPSTSYAAPSPSYTRGKWDSSERPWGPLRKPNTGYWCGPCNRRLSSRIVYERHIKSELHFKRTNPWRTLTTLGKRVIKRTRIAQESTLRVLNRRTKREVKGVKRRRAATVCEVCNYRVAPHLMGKHLISYYHCTQPRDSAVNDAIVLKNILSIVRQAPFQCGLCKFFCNSQQEFLTHWASEMHRANDVKRTGVYWCPNCNIEADSSADMGFHLVDDLHTDRMMAINLSVPIVIQKISPLQCDVCGKCFRYNIQIRAHSKFWGHEQTRGSASDSYQEALSCSECSYRCNSLVSFQRHCYMKHRKVPYFCRRCGLSFKSSAEVQKHRKSTEHRDAAGPKTRRCPHCQLSFVKIASLKSHLEEVHPDYKHRCLKCGWAFTLKQQLSQHALSCEMSETRKEVAYGVETVSAGDDVPQPPKDVNFSCSRCSFVGKTESELLVHKLLHDNPEKSSGKFVCPYCNKTFSDSYMKKHMMTHTSERPYSCQICNFSFSRQDTLNRHVANMHQAEMGDSSLKYHCHLCSKQVPTQNALDRHMKSLHQDRTRSFKCGECGQAFYVKGTLNRHMQTHFGKKFKCTEEGCIFLGRSLGELKIHSRTHSESRDYRCQQCSYSSKTKHQLTKHMKSIHFPKNLLKCTHCQFTCKTGTHLTRHRIIHSGSKPYQCPHCPFNCTSLDNLRKHIIYSKIHPGKSVYECRTKGCSFTSNLSKDFKSHLVREHNFQMKNAIAHVAGIYQPVSESVEANKVHKQSDDDLTEEDDPKVQGEYVVEAEVEEEATLEEFVFSADAVDVGVPLPTLASVALTPAKTDEDIIFIHIGAPEEQQYDSHMFHPSFPIIETFPGQSHYDPGEIEAPQEDNT